MLPIWARGQPVQALTELKKRTDDDGAEGDRLYDLATQIYDAQLFAQSWTKKNIHTRGCISYLALDR